MHGRTQNVFRREARLHIQRNVRGIYSTINTAGNVAPPCLRWTLMAYCGFNSHNDSGDRLLEMKAREGGESDSPPSRAVTSPRKTMLGQNWNILNCESRITFELNYHGMISSKYRPDSRTLVSTKPAAAHGDFLPEGVVRSGLLRSQAASLTFLMAVDAVTRPSLWEGRSQLSLHGRAGLDGPQMTRAGSFGLSTLRALSAPLTGNRAGLSNPICTKTLA